MICHQLKLIFVHPPKTAGHSIESAIMDYLEIPWDDRRELLLGYNTDPELGPPVLDHLTAKEYRGLGYVSAKTWDNYLKVGTIRNPFERLLSEWRFREHKISFKSWLMDHFPEEEWSDFYTHVIPQHVFLGLHTDFAVDTVIRFEHLEEDFVELCRALNLPETLELPKWRVSVKDGPEDYREWFDYDMRWRAERLYCEDLENLKYDFDTGSRHDREDDDNHIISGCRGLRRAI